MHALSVTGLDRRPAAAPFCHASRAQASNHAVGGAISAPRRPQHRQESSSRGGASSCSRRRQLHLVAAAASSNAQALLEQPALVLAGFYIEELATVRQLLDQMRGNAVKVIPATPALLHTPVANALAAAEPAWDQPVPAEWQHGGGWGQQRMVLMSGLSEEQFQLILSVLEEVELSPVVPALASPGNLGAPLGEVLAAALKLWRKGPPAPPPRQPQQPRQQQRQRQQPGTASASAAAPAAAKAEPAPATTQPAAGMEEPAVPFVEELPPVEAVLPSEVLQPEPEQQWQGQQRYGGGGGRAGAAEVVQAEFTEAAPAQQAPQRAQQAASADNGDDLPLDVIDAIAAGAEPRAVVREDGLSREEAAELAAAAAALGLDSPTGQQLVDGVAAKAADAMSVPFVLDGADGRSADVTSSSSGGSSSGGAAQAAAQPAATPVRPGPSSSGAGARKPWEAASQPASGAATAPSGSGGSASRGFGAAYGQSKAGKKGPRRALGDQSKKAAAEILQERLSDAGVAAVSSGAKGGSSSGSGSSNARPARGADVQGTFVVSDADAREEGGSRGAQPGSSGSAGTDGGAVIPPVESFVLSKTQLKEVADRHGLDWEEMLQGLGERGIQLAE